MADTLKALVEAFVLHNWSDNMADLDILTRWAERRAASRNRVIRDTPRTLRTAGTVDEKIAYLRRYIIDASRPIENPAPGPMAASGRRRRWGSEWWMSATLHPSHYPPRRVNMTVAR